MNPKTTAKWYVGVMNDAPFIIDAPPRPSTDDCVHDRKDGPDFVVRVHGLRDQDVKDIVEEHNRVVDVLSEIKRDLEQLEPEMKKEWDIAGFFCPWNDLIHAMPEDLRMQGYSQSPMEFVYRLTDQRDEAKAEAEQLKTQLKQAHEKIRSLMQ
jgi:hypothetical protein